MDRPRLEVADVFRRYGEAYRQNHGASMSAEQRRVMAAIEVCRTAVLGGHLERCDQCGYPTPHNQERHISHKMLSSTSYDGSGLWVCSKKLDGGRFRWPQRDSTVKKIVLTHEELALLLGGIDLTQTRPRKWYRKTVDKEPTESLKTA